MVCSNSRLTTDCKDEWLRKALENAYAHGTNDKCSSITIRFQES